MASVVVVSLVTPRIMVVQVKRKAEGRHQERKKVSGRFKILSSAYYLILDFDVGF